MLSRKDEANQNSRVKSYSKALGFLLALLLTLYAAACLFVYFRQAHFIFSTENDVPTTPKDFHLNYQDVYIPVTNRSGKTENIHGWWIPNPNKEAKPLLYLHGNGAIGANAEHANRLYNLGFSVLLIDYRGFGRSEGEFPSESQMYEDAQAAWNYLVLVKKQTQKIFIYGHSLGGAVAVDLALRHPEAAGLMVESSFTSILDLTDRYAWTKFFPMSLILTQRFDSLAKVKSLEVPVLFIHGTADQTIPFQMSQRLFAAAASPRQLELIPKADHANDAIVAGPRYLEFVRNFVRKQAPPAPQPI